MYTHGKSCNNVGYRDSEVMFRTKSLSRHIRDPDKVENVWTGNHVFTLFDLNYYFKNEQNFKKRLF